MSKSSSILLWIVVVFAVGLTSLLIIDTIGILDIYQITFPLMARDFATIISAAGSILLAFGLITLYYEQTEVQKRQEEWMEGEHTPDLSIDSWEVDSNLVYLNLVNLGNGIAKNLRLKIEIEPVGEKIPIRIVSNTPLWRADPSSRVIEDRMTETVQFSTNEEVPRFNIEYKYLEGAFMKWSPYELPAQANFNKVASSLDKNGIDSIEYKLILEYEFVTRRNNSICFWEAEGEVQEDITLNELIDGPQIDTAEGSVTPDNLK